MPESIDGDQLAERLTTRIGIRRPKPGPRPNHKVVAMLREVEANRPGGVRWSAEEIPHKPNGEQYVRRSLYYALRKEAKRQGYDVHVSYDSKDLPEGSLEVWHVEDFRAAREQAKQLVRERHETEGES